MTYNNKKKLKPQILLLFSVVFYGKLLWLTLLFAEVKYKVNNFHPIRV